MRIRPLRKSPQSCLSGDGRNRARKSRRSKSLRFESLENRRMLSVTPPTVEELLIGGQAWRDAFIARLNADGLGNGGFRLTADNANQTLPWSNLNRLTVRFNEGVSVQASDLRIQGVESGVNLPLADGGFQYNASTFTATWTFASPFDADRYAITLSDRVTNAMGLALDGEGAPRTGNGAPGGDFVFPFSIVPGDGNGDGVTNMHDGLGVRGRMFTVTTSATYSPRYDFDGSGAINILDGLEFRDKLFEELPAAQLDLEGPGILAGLAHDTGAINTEDFDGVTRNPQLTGVALDEFGVQSLFAHVDGGAGIPVIVEAEGRFTFDPPLATDGSADGVHTVRFLARDSFGNQSESAVSFTLDTQGPAIGPLSLSAGSGLVGPQTSSAGRVTLLGASTPGLTVALVGTGMSALVNNQGEFQFPSVPLVVGANTFTAAVTDAAGNTTQVPTVIQRVELAAQQDPVLRWNQALLDAVQLDASAPTFASRAMAMVHGAIYDAVSAIEGTPGYSVTLAAPTGISLEAAVSGAAHRVLSYLYPAQQALFNTVRTAALGQVPDGAAEMGGVAFGETVGDAIIALRSDDGWDDFVDYVPGTAPGDWQQTEPLYAPALDPQWANLPSFSGADLDELTPSGPPALSSLEWATALNEVKSLGSFNSTTRTADQLQIARFWADGSGTHTPPGHWNKIAQQVAVAAGNSIAENARLFAKLDIALADAAILAWKAKFETDFWRPFTAIHNAADDGNDLTTADATWQPLLITPNFPEYISGHSTFSGAAAAVLTSVFGANYSFTTTSSGLLNVNRTFASFDAAATEAGRSRIYGGIHYEFSNQDGQAAGRALAAQVLSTFDAAADVVAPTIVVETETGGTTATNQTIVGRVLDNLSGVATLTASVDGAAAAPVTFDALGRFTLTTSLALNGVAEGAHQVALVATDFQGNVSDPQLFSFTLDTLAPTIEIIAPEEGATLEGGSLLTGLANGTGSSIVELKYAFIGQPARTIPFNAATGEFSVPLNTAALGPGAAVLTVSIRDAAGHTSSVMRNLTVAQRAAFSVERFTPLNGAQDVGSTYRPQVFFSRAVNPTSLNANNFYATGPNGAKLAANIVPAGDGSFAWLFFTQPMPSASQITVHVNGATILAAADGAQLDADDNGTAGGELTFQFTTVSLTPLVGTSLSGKVVEAGPDLKPMTFDDIRVGPDQVLHTADDVFLTPLAGVKVFIVGLESQFVLTDAQGNFSFPSAPAGNVKLAIDGRTATNAPAGTFFPEMVMDLNLEAGRANTVMGTMGTLEQQEANRDRQEVYLPRLQTSILQNVSGAAPTTITTSEAAAPNITPEQRALLTIQVQPGSMRDQNGNPVAAGQVGISTVPAALVREMLPLGLLQHTFDITVQAPGVTNFATPAPMTFPNLFGGKPGEQLNFLSFDHTTGRLVIEGTATVSADGLSVATDPGTGITHPGWHGLAPPGSPTRPDDDDDEVEELGTEFLYSITTEVLSDRPVEPGPVAGIAVDARSSSLAAVIQGVTDHLLTDPTERVQFSIKNDTNPKKSDGSYLSVRFIIDPAIAHKYVDGLKHTVFKLVPGKTAKFDFTLRTPDILKLDHDVLIGVKYKLEIDQVSKAGVITKLPESGEYFAYRYVDAVDDAVFDHKLKFPDALNDGAGGVLRTRSVEYRGDTSPTVIPTLLTASISLTDDAGLADFSATQFALVDGKHRATLTFDPQRYEDNSEVHLRVQTPGQAPRVVKGVIGDSNYQLILVGTGVAPREIYLNKEGLEAQLERIASNRRPQDITLEYTLPKGKTVSDLSTRFVLSYNGRVTAPQPLDISGTALYLNLIPVVGFSNFTVVGSTEKTEIKTGAQKGSTKVVQSYRIEYSDNVADSVIATKFVVLPPVGGTFKSTVAFDFNDQNAEITNNEFVLINTPENRDAFVANVLGRVRQHFAGFSSTVTLHDGDKPGAAYSVDWTTVYEDKRFGRTPTVADETLKPLEELLKRRKTLNSAQFEFEVAAIMSKTQSGGVEIYVEQFFAHSYPHFDTSFDFMTRAMAKTTAHELGHNLGLMHNADKEGDVKTDEVQVIDVRSLGPDDFFTLKFAGEPTAPIRPGATGEEVRDALRALNSFKNTKAIDVVAGPAGFYLVKFVLPKTVSNPKPDFHGIDLPELQVFGPGGISLGAGSVITTTNGDTTLRTLFEITTTNSSGVQQSTLNDIMAAGPVVGDTSFQEKTSGAGLKLATRGQWNSDDVKNFLSQMLKIIKYVPTHYANSSGFFDAVVPDAGEVSTDVDSFFFEGAFLELFAADPDGTTDFVDETIDFGSASTFTPSIKRFSIANLGSEPATIRSIGITKGSAVFSTPTIAARVLAPGESLEFEVTFGADAVLDYEGTLSIDSDLPEFNGNFDLIGNGRPSNTPAITYDFYNNLQGVQLGVRTGFGGAINPKLTNNGTGPLVISEIRVAEGQGFGEWQTPALTQPITLAPGESTNIGMTFSPSKLGLRPGAFEVLSNDPRTPLLCIPVVATGVIDSNYLINGVPPAYEGVDLGNDYVVVGDMLTSYFDFLPDLRTRSDDAGNWEFFLPAQTGMTAVTFDPVSGLVMNSSAYTNASGVSTITPWGGFKPSVSPDTDGDGLPDDIEFAIGTNENKVDTDGDGKNDFVEIDGGFNPIDDRPAANGIVSALSTGNTALDIKLAADFADPSRTVAYIASGLSGLTVVDVTDFARPITISQLSLPGLVNNLSLDVGRKIIAASSPDNGVSLIDVSNPARPTLLRTFAHEGTDPVAAVELYDGLAFVAVGNKIRNLDMQSGEVNGELVLAGQRVVGMTRSGDYLYVTARDTTSNQFSLRIVELTATALVARGVLAIPGVTALGDPYVTNDILRLRNELNEFGEIIGTFESRGDVAWIPAGDRIVTVEVSNRQSPEIITSTATIAQGGAADIEINGSGLAVIAGVVNPGGSAIVLQARYPNDPNQIFTRFALPSFGEAVALSSGLAYIADGSSGLQLVNYLQRDTGLEPPTIVLSPLSGDLNPTQPGVQLNEGSTITLGARITDNVQVQKVELLVDGIVVRTEVSFPYDLTTTLPTIAEAGAQVVLQVRATDTGGNSTLSPPIVVDLLADTTAPTITSLEPAAGSVETLARRKVVLQFSEALDPTTAIAANFVLQGPGGPVTPISLDARQRDTRVEILYPPLAEGAYTFTTHAAAVKDRAGNAVGTVDVTSTFTIAPAVRQPTIRWVNDAGGAWGTASNWLDVATNAARVPTTTDDVLIDVPTDALITFGSGVVTVNSIVSNEQFVMNGGSLTVTDTMQVNNTFTLGINQFFSNNIPTFKGTLLRGTGGQGLTLSGESRLNTATIQTDINVVGSAQLRLAGGLALTGTLTGPTAANSNIQIGLEGSQTIASGTFVASEAASNAGLMLFVGIGPATVTFGQEVNLRGQVRLNDSGYFQPPAGQSNRLDVVNYGTMKVGGLAETSTFGISLGTGANSFINHGLIESQGAGTLSLSAKTFTNSTTGRIKIEQPVGSSQASESLGAAGLTTSFTNAGSIELINAAAQILSRADGLNEVFTNTGTITNNKGRLTINGAYTTADVANIPNTGFVISSGVMNNVGQTFTYANTAGVFFMGGRTLGGTIVKLGAAELNVSGTLVGVTMEGDFNSSLHYNDPITGALTFRTMSMTVEQGLTVRGTISFYRGLSSMSFVGAAQTVTGGTFQFFSGTSSGGLIAVRATAGGAVTFDSTATIRAATNSEEAIVGNFIINAPINLEANSSLRLEGIQNATAPVSLINRGTITVPATSTLNVFRPFANEGQIVVNGGTMNVGDYSNNLVDPFRNTGTINLAGGGRLNLSSAKSDGRVTFSTADLGTILDLGGFVEIGGNVVLDNSGVTLPIDGTAQWLLFGRIVGGTIQVENTAKLEARGGLLKDVVINGNFSSPSNSVNGVKLVGEVDLNGTYTAQRLLEFGHPTLYPGTPLILRGGEFIAGIGSGVVREIVGYSTVTTVTLDPDVVLRGRGVNATFDRPLTNRGQIVADLALVNDGYRFSFADTFHFTAAPITNEGSLSAINRAILRIANLAAPNTGVVSATSGSVVEFTGAFAQSAVGTTRIDVGGAAIPVQGGTFTNRFGQITVGADASLAGKLEVNFISGFTPTVGSRYQVLNYASHTGQFDTVSVTGLAAGLALTPEYNGTNMTLVVTAAPASLAQIVAGAFPASVALSSGLSPAIATEPPASAEPNPLSLRADEALLLWQSASADSAVTPANAEFEVFDPLEQEADSHGTNTLDEAFAEFCCPLL